jgi:hypothetical protein
MLRGGSGAANMGALPSVDTQQFGENVSMNPMLNQQMFKARGGLIHHFADGDSVDDDSAPMQNIEIVGQREADSAPTIKERDPIQPSDSELNVDVPGGLDSLSKDIDTTEPYTHQIKVPEPIQPVTEDTMTKSTPEKMPDLVKKSPKKGSGTGFKAYEDPKMEDYKAEVLTSKKHSSPLGLAPLVQIKQAHGGLAHAYKAAAPEGHHPEFITGITGYYACGGGTGQSDDIPAMLHDGDYVMDAETVSALGDGSSKAGKHVLEGFRQQVKHSEKPGSNPVPAKIADGEYVFPAAFVTAIGGGDNKKGSEILDGLRHKLREHKRSAPIDKIPPKAKSPLDYIKKGSK